MAKTQDTPETSESPVTNSEPIHTGVTLSQQDMGIVGDENANSTERPPLKELTGVKYSGIADRKIFTTEDLKKLGAENIQTDLEWNAGNGFVVPISDLNASTVDALIKLPGFTAV